MQVCRTNRDQVGQMRGEIWKPDAVSILVDNTCNNFLGVQVFFALIHSANWAILLNKSARCLAAHEPQACLIRLKLGMQNSSQSF